MTEDIIKKYVLRNRKISDFHILHLQSTEGKNSVKCTPVNVLEHNHSSMKFLNGSESVNHAQPGKVQVSKADGFKSPVGYLRESM